MTDGHMDRLTALDASFLTNETGPSHMHIGALVIFEGQPPAYEELISQHTTLALDNPISRSLAC